MQVKGVKSMDELAEIKEKLNAIETLLQRLPEIQAAVFIQMNEEYQIAKMQGLKSSDLWTIAPPYLRSATEEDITNIAQAICDRQRGAQGRPDSSR